MMKTRKRRWWLQHWRGGRPMTPLSIQDQIEEFMSIDNQDKRKSHNNIWRCQKKATKNYKGW
jgi:hypothetical protein